VKFHLIPKQKIKLTKLFFTFYFSPVGLVSVSVNGTGIIAEMIQDFANILKPLVKMNTFHITPCLPHPKVPNYEYYEKIFILIAIAWILLLFEPYALRSKILIVDHYYPQRAIYRASWLYRQISGSRKSILKYLRKEIRKKMGAKGEKDEKSLTFMSVLKAKLFRLLLEMQI
jgi:DC-STAMP-like protein